MIIPESFTNGILWCFLVAGGIIALLAVVAVICLLFAKQIEDNLQ